MKNVKYNAGEKVKSCLFYLNKTMTIDPVIRQLMFWNRSLVLLSQQRVSTRKFNLEFWFSDNFVRIPRDS